MIVRFKRQLLLLLRAEVGACAQRCPELSITTRHTYEIHRAFQWRCANEACGLTYGRHSKSIDIKRHVCGKCRTALEFVGRRDAPQEL